MRDTEYWVNISRDGTRLGAGFLLTGCYVLTAHHCLEDAVPGGDDVEVEFASGEVLPGQVYRRSPSADLALIDVPKSATGPIIPRADRATAGEAWRNPYRPSLSHALLSGTIDAVPVSYQCEGGDLVEVMQLRCAQDLEDYAGYSGSPIESSGPDRESKLFGILIEKYLKHYPDNSEPRPASMVLYAATLSEVFRRFDCFNLDHLINLLPSSSGHNAPVSGEGNGRSPAGGSAWDDAQLHIAIADAKIQALDGWRKRGQLDEQYFTQLTFRVADLHLLGRDAGEQS